MNDTKPDTVPEKCINCSAELTSPVVCSGCHTLYPLPQSVDYFGLLGLPRAYDLDESALEKRFLSVSRHIHPDYFGSASGEMQQLSVRLSAELNQAVKVLRQPVLRAGYLLELCGGPGPASDRTVPPEVLGETMMLREEIEEAQADEDHPALQRLRKTVEEKRAVLVERIAELARRLPNAAAEDKTALRHTLNAVKYYDNMLELLWEA
ncbi:MAG TPA: Fe-S protein assembly co-chaperone HscB [Phycisphaerae bacterium]|nr:Fe-S protein assembly co-chaperone HscB [Phycisphaerales bacterium]HRX85281.1 Fe-S protein assembly co-chaperone HscB [Phycisphaerae bacterium]